MVIEIKPSFVETSQSFIKYIKFYGGYYYQWYVGISTNPKHSFLNIHKVDMLSKSWILSNECHKSIAQFLKKFLISIGCFNNSDLDYYEPGQIPSIYLFRMHDGSKLIEAI
ncbi:MAG: hypothetical protein GY714_33095 [Desulfobacterales bacterium]|nr:hypothetical protein [Desulfobacterales bacterium]